MNSRKYWQQRALERMAITDEISEEIEYQVRKLYQRSINQIREDIDKIFSTYRIKGSLSEKDALKLLTTVQRRSYLDNLRSQLEDLPEDEYKRALATLNAPAYRYRMTRLMTLEEQIKRRFEEVARQEIALLERGIEKTMTSEYYKLFYDIQRRAGVYFGVDEISTKTLQKLVHEKWAGSNFSDRVWKNTNIVAERASEIVKQNILTGRSYQRCINELTEYVDSEYVGARYASKRLILTEQLHAHNRIDEDIYKKLGIMRYVFLATLDERTCTRKPNCRAHDGMKDPNTGEQYTIPDLKYGENYPPLHPFCRCTTFGYFDKDTVAYIRRLARRKDGSTYATKDYITYDEWIKKQQEEPKD